MKVAFLGLGNMGLPMARNILQAGHELTVWNRSHDKAAQLANDGARLAASPREAAQNAISSVYVSRRLMSSAQSCWARTVYCAACDVAQ